MPDPALSARLLLSVLAQLAPNSRVSYEKSLALVALVSLGLLGVPLAIGIVSEWRARRRAAALRRAVDGQLGPLVAGECVLAGVIESEDGPGRVVGVELHQKCTEIRTKNGTSYRWDETSRQVDARPFHLRLDDGRSVRIEPDGRTFVVDALDGVRMIDSKQRVRTAEVSAGDRVFVLGELVPGYDPRAQLQSGYRGDRAGSLVVRAHARRPMLVSTEVPSARHVRREGFHGNWALVFTVALLLTHLLAFRTFDVLALTGTRVEATVIDRTVRWESTKRGGHFRHFVTAQYENVSGRLVTIEDEVSPASVDTLAVGRRGVFTVSTFSAAIAAVGERPGVGGVAAFITIFLSGLLVFFYRLTTSASRPWYEQAKIVEYGAGSFATAPSHSGPRSKRRSRGRA
jgi:hypothetical protein